eukprot:4564052-Lingulodinium_polyedra.AAC.1
MAKTDAFARSDALPSCSGCSICGMSLWATTLNSVDASALTPRLPRPFVARSGEFANLACKLMMSVLRGAFWRNDGSNRKMHGFV